MAPRPLYRTFVATFALAAGLVLAVACASDTTAPASTDNPGGTGDPGTTTGTTSGGTLNGRLVFPADNAWNKDVAAEPVDANSAALIASCGGNAAVHPDFGTVYNGAPNGIPYVLVSGNQARVPVTFEYAAESDPGPYPIPANAPIEGGAQSSGDRHVIVIDTTNWKLYELFAAYPTNGGTRWVAGSGAVFDLSSNAMRPAG